MADEAEDANEDIDLDAEGEGEAGEEKKGGLKKLILFIGLPAVIVILGAVAGVLMFTGGDDEEELAEAESELSEEAPSAADEAVAYFEMEESPALEIVTDIDTGGNNPALLEIHIVLVYGEPEIGALLEREDVRNHLTDTYMEFIRTLRVDDINGSMGTYRLRSELLRRSNLVLAPATVERVLLPQILIQ